MESLERLFLFWVCLSMFSACQNDVNDKRVENKKEVVVSTNINSKKENALALLMRPNSFQLNQNSLNNLGIIKGFRSMQLGQQINELFFSPQWHSIFPYRNSDSILEYKIDLGELLTIEDVYLKSVTLTFFKSKLVQIKFEPTGLNKDFISQYSKLYGKPNIKNQIQLYNEIKDEDAHPLSEVLSKHFKNKAECEAAIKKITPENTLIVWRYKNIKYTIEQVFTYMASKNYNGEQYQTNLSSSFYDNFWAIQITKAANAIKIELVDEMSQVEKTYSNLSKQLNEESKRDNDSLTRKSFNSL